MSDLFFEHIPDTTDRMIESVKKSMSDLVQGLPDNCTWDEVMYQVYVRQKIAAGLEDVAQGRVVPHDEVFEEIEDEPHRMDAHRN
jgi:predicted transcriptional regulator